MSLQDYLINSLSAEYHQSYVNARQKEGIVCLTDYNEWIAKNNELENLITKNNADTWENSEYNPANYPDFDSLDDDTKQQRITQGKLDYLTDSEAIEAKISELRHLLTHPDELVRDTDSEDDSEPAEYWTVND